MICPGRAIYQCCERVSGSRVGCAGCVSMSTNFGTHVARAASEVRSGPFSNMRCMTPLTSEDLIRGAERFEREAAARRQLASTIQGREVPAYWAAARVAELMNDV